MPAQKRNLIETIDEIAVDVKDEQGTPPPQKKKSKISSAKKPSPAKSLSSGSDRALSARALFLEMLVEGGLRDVDKKSIESATGLSAKQQHEMMRKDKGALRRALGQFLESL